MSTSALVPSQCAAPKQPFFISIKSCEWSHLCPYSFKCHLHNKFKLSRAEVLHLNGFQKVLGPLKLFAVFQADILLYVLLARGPRTFHIFSKGSLISLPRSR